MSLRKKKHAFMIFVVIVFVVLPVAFISLGNYDLSSKLGPKEEREFLQVIYSLSASMFILMYYGFKWIMKRNKRKIFCVLTLNILGIFSLYLLFETVNHQLFMDADFYYLIVYTEIVIVHLMYHLFTKTSIV